MTTSRKKDVSMLRVVIALFMFAAMTIPVLAQDVPCDGCGSLLESRLSALAMTDGWYIEARDVLMNAAPETWTDEQVNSYLEVALLRIYTATNIHAQQLPMGDLNLSGLQEFSCLDEWPGNPLNSWEPVRIVETAAGFMPGDIACELCPATYSTKGYRLSYQYYMYGADLDCALPDVYGRNAEWAMVPEGTAFTLGVIYQTDEEIEATRQFMQRVAKQKADRMQDENDEAADSRE